MGQTPARVFPPPQPFGSTPQTNNVSQVQPLAQVQGPGFAGPQAFDQTAQQTPQLAQNTDNTAFMQNPMARIKRGDTNPFFGLLNQ